MYGRRSREIPFRRGAASRLGAALYLLLFLGLTLAVRHDHQNGLADLSTESPSDSGIFLKTSGAEPSPGSSALASSTVVRDQACLACFFSDVAATAAESLTVALFLATLLFLFSLPAASPAAIDLLPPADRGPPRL